MRRTNENEIEDYGTKTKSRRDGLIEPKVL